MKNAEGKRRNVYEEVFFGGGGEVRRSEKEKDEKYHGQGKIVQISGRTDLKGFAKGPRGP